MEAVLIIFKDLDTDYNANNLSKRLGITPMGTLKILKRLEKEGILRSKKLGKAVFYRPDFRKDFTKTYLKFILQKEAEQAMPRIRRWVEELRKFRSVAEIGILFGSVLTRKEFRDVDLLLVFKQQQSRKIEKLLDEMAQLNVKRIHAVKQTREDLGSNLKAKDRVVLSILKQGVILFGYDDVIEVVESVTYR